MAGPLLVTHNVSKHFGGFSALNDVSLEVGPGERVGLIGPNGSGKTTLINIITGSLPPNMGKIIFNDRDISGLPAYRRARLGMARTFQIPKPFTSSTLLENLTITMKFAPDAEGRDRDQESMQILRLIGIESKAHMRPGELNQIELRKLELARALALNPKILFLDEVMAGLSSSEVDELLEVLVQLNARGIAILMIEHIMRAVMSFCKRVVVLNAGEKIAEGTPPEILSNKEVEKAYLGE
jgi:branched-chain amino acid transport system ATP-binding protein